jgi:hypothetical protein
MSGSIAICDLQFPRHDLAETNDFAEVEGTEVGIEWLIHKNIVDREKDSIVTISARKGFAVAA